MPCCLGKYDPNSPRFYLTATASETRDAEACPVCPERSRGKCTEESRWEDSAAE